MRALIVDDEPLARRRLRGLLEEIGGVEITGEAADGDAAVAAIDAHRPDVVFLDVQMPGVTGLEVVRRIAHDPAVVFTTAYDRYAVAAFELQAIDYLLKPFGRERVVEALDRARRASEIEGPSTSDRLRAAQAARPEHVLVRDRGRLVPLATREIVRLAAEDDYSRAFTTAGHHLIYLALADFERVLDPSTFVRIHRSHVVSLAHVRCLHPADGGRFTVEMKDGTMLPVSRARAKELRERAF